jgi:hypothetical protein
MRNCSNLPAAKEVVSDAAKATKVVEAAVAPRGPVLQPSAYCESVSKPSGKSAAKKR